MKRELISVAVLAIATNLLYSYRYHIQYYILNAFFVMFYSLSFWSYFFGVAVITVSVALLYWFYIANQRALGEQEQMVLNNLSTKP